MKKRISSLSFVFHFVVFFTILLQNAQASENSNFSKVVTIEVVSDNADNTDGGNAWGGHQCRIVRTNEGVFTAYTVMGDSPMNKRWKLAHRQADGWKVIAEGAAGREPVNLIAGPDGKIYILGWPNGQPTLWFGLPSGGQIELNSELVPFTTDDYPYASAGIDRDGNIFVLASQLANPDYFKYSIRDNSTGNWRTQTKELDYRHCYSYILPDNNGGLFVVSTRDVEWSDLGLVKPEGAFDYAFNAFSLFGTSDYRESPIDRRAYVKEEQTTAYPDVLCNAQNDSYLDNSGRVHVLLRRKGETTNGLEQGRHIIFSKNGTIESDEKLPVAEGTFSRIFQDKEEKFYILTSSGHIYYAGESGTDLGVAQKLDLNGYEVEYSGFSIAAPRTGTEPANFIDAVFPTDNGRKWVYCRIALGTGDFKQMSSLTTLTYQNSLKNQTSIDNDFQDFSYLVGADDGSQFAFDNAAFTANSSIGLELVSQTPYFANGIKWFNRSLPISSDWQIDVKAHLSNFPTEFPNPYYYAILIIGKSGSDLPSSAANRIVFSLTRSKQTSENVTNEYFKNTVNFGVWSNNASDKGAPPSLQISAEDVYLKIKYLSNTKSCYLYYSQDSIQYNELKNYNIGDIWSLGSGNSIYVALNAGSEPFQTLSEYNENSNKDFNLAPGQLYFSDFKISPIVTGTTNVSGASGGGAPSGGGSPAAQKAKKGGKSSAKKSSGSASKKSAGSKNSSGKKSKKK
jgi:hypothetical protein